MNATSSSSPDTPLREGDIIGLFGTIGAIHNGQVMVQFDDPLHDEDAAVPFDPSTLRLVRRITKVGDIVLNPQNERVIVHNISNGNMAHVTKENADLEEADSYQTLRIGQLTHIGQVNEGQFGKELSSVSKTPTVSSEQDADQDNETSSALSPQATLADNSSTENAGNNGGTTEEAIFDLDDADYQESAPSVEQQEETSQTVLPALTNEQDPAPEVQENTTEALEVRPLEEAAQSVVTAADAAERIEEVQVEDVAADNPSADTAQENGESINANAHQSEQDEAESAVANIREAKSRGSAMFDENTFSALRRQPEEP